MHAILTAGLKNTYKGSLAGVWQWSPSRGTRPSDVMAHAKRAQSAPRSIRSTDHFATAAFFPGEDSSCPHANSGSNSETMVRTPIEQIRFTIRAT